LKEMPPEEVLQQPDVDERVRMMREQNVAFLDVLKKHSRKDGNVVITDFRTAEKIPVGNRFLVYTIVPEVNVSVRLQWGPQMKFVATTLGHNIFNRTCKTNIGRLCSKYGGGGHKGAGACVLEPEKADTQIAEIVRELKKAG